MPENKEERKARARSAIIATVQRYAPGANPAALIRIAERESGLNPQAIGDEAIAARVYEKQRERIRKDGNPWADDPSRWGGSFGLFQLMAPYMFRIWNPKADPYDLFKPEVATITAARLWNRAVKAGARDFAQVRLYWGYGPRGLEYGPGSKEYDERAANKWSLVEGIQNPPVSRYNYSAFGTGPGDAGQGPSPGPGGSLLLPVVFGLAAGWLAVKGLRS